MKRLLILLIAVIAMSCVHAVQTDSRLEAMGGIRIAARGDSFGFISNPAELFFRENENSLLLEGGFGNTFSPSDDMFPADPVTHINGMISGGFISLDISLDYNVEKDRKIGGIWNCNAFQTSVMSLQVAAGYGSIGVGLGVFGGSRSQRLSVKVNPENAISSYIGACFLGTYDRVSNSEFLQMNTGIMFVSGPFSAGVLFDDILDTDGGKTSVSVDSFFSETGVGVFFSRPKYNNLGHLNIWGFSIGADVSDILSEDEVSFSLGGGVEYRLMSSCSISVLGGYSSFDEAYQCGVFTVGGRADIGRVSLLIDFCLPSSGGSWSAGVSGALMI